MDALSSMRVRENTTGRVASEQQKSMVSFESMVVNCGSVPPQRNAQSVGTMQLSAEGHIPPTSSG